MTHEQTTSLTAVRKATKKEHKERGADVVFTRENSDGREYTIYGCVCYESWEQWGADREVLSDNVDTIERWRRNELGIPCEATGLATVRPAAKP